MKKLNQNQREKLHIVVYGVFLFVAVALSLGCSSTPAYKDDPLQLAFEAEQRQQAKLNWIKTCVSLGGIVEYNITPHQSPIRRRGYAHVDINDFRCVR